MDKNVSLQEIQREFPGFRVSETDDPDQGFILDMGEVSPQLLFGLPRRLPLRDDGRAYYVLNGAFGAAEIRESLPEIDFEAGELLLVWGNLVRAEADGEKDTLWLTADPSAGDTVLVSTWRYVPREVMLPSETQTAWAEGYGGRMMRKIAYSRINEWFLFPVEAGWRAAQDVCAKLFHEWRQEADEALRDYPELKQLYRWEFEDLAKIVAAENAAGPLAERNIWLDFAEDWLDVVQVTADGRCYRYELRYNEDDWQACQELLLALLTDEPCAAAEKYRDQTYGRYACVLPQGERLEVSWFLQP